MYRGSRPAKLVGFRNWPAAIIDGTVCPKVRHEQALPDNLRNHQRPDCPAQAFVRSVTEMKHVAERACGIKPIWIGEYRRVEHC